MTTAERIDKYEPLTEQKVIQLVQQLRLLPSDGALTCEEIGDGNLNYVFRVIDERSQQSLIVKQALPYAKVVGESWPLSLNRASIEYQALRIQGELTPDFVPKVYYSDTTYAITIMEDLSQFDILRGKLIDGEHYPNLGKHIGEFIAKTLFFTSDFYLDAETKKQRVKQFINPDLCKITEDLVFTDPFFDHDTNDFEEELREDVANIWDDLLLKLEVAKLKKLFLTRSDALVHGDLHTGSIFVTETDTKVIDPEFAFYGPLGFDIGQFIANILLNAITKQQEQQRQLLQLITDTWEHFSETFTELWKTQGQEKYTQVDGYVEHVLTETFEDAIGFAGCEIIRRTIGLAHVADLDEITEYSELLSSKRHALSLGKELIFQRSKLTSPRQITLY
ncbi:S-methyl-5-thioribose kinase [Bacillus solimangrovi]|uniref:Methylthioribose kinase n=1 Tax=Bacillus solimangrovi TaxID=1305675 RepID=A0A1E5LE56_9BACI|nr:S-methyl-5-thioribose kinase [Bacillus solimangrovi]OEH92377.1 S-methyl-5-thioribose kinase [Bacillus solimangrovi]